MKTLWVFFTIFIIVSATSLGYAQQDDIIFDQDGLIQSINGNIELKTKGSITFRSQNGQPYFKLGRGGNSSEFHLFSSGLGRLEAYGKFSMSSYSEISLWVSTPVPNAPRTVLSLRSKALGINITDTPSTIGSIDLSTYKLFVNGGVLAKEVRVRTDWADYVFDPSYSLLPLPEVETFIATNGHLPNVPDATTVAEEGIEIGNMTRIQQEKIEELTLYTIQQNKQITAQQARIEALEARLAKLEAFMTKK